MLTDHASRKSPTPTSLNFDLEPAGEYLRLDHHQVPALQRGECRELLSVVFLLRVRQGWRAVVTGVGFSPTTATLSHAEGGQLGGDPDVQPFRLYLKVVLFTDGGSSSSHQCIACVPSVR